MEVKSEEVPKDIEQVRFSPKTQEELWKVLGSSNKGGEGRVLFFDMTKDGTQAKEVNGERVKTRILVQAIIEDPEDPDYVYVAERDDDTGFKTAFVGGGMQEEGEMVETVEQVARRETKDETGFENIESTEVLDDEIHILIRQEVKKEFRYGIQKFVKMKLKDADQKEIIKDLTDKFKLKKVKKSSLTAEVCHRNIQYIVDKHVAPQEQLGDQDLVRVDRVNYFTDEIIHNVQAAT